MSQYDLNIFSPTEFEEFSRDILQARLNVFIESFKMGKDEGIDLRFSTSEGNDVIIQSKRYEDFPSLLRNLKKEVLKVEKLKPSSYIITTSVPLSFSNKKKIKELFEPYIKSTEDIYGKHDLLNILDQNKQIEQKYHKLWLASTTILEKIFHSKIYNQSQFELDEIKNQTKLYVQNDSFYDALNILNKHRYIIISGIPGIGKTALARILTQHLLSNGYEELIYLNDKIDDGYIYFKEDKMQIFLFDDFLGRNFFDAKDLYKNDEKLIKFINKIKISPNKTFILTTREYILNQAKEIYEIFKIDNLEIAKCIINLSTYTRLVKSKILYNHLFYWEIPNKYLEDIIKNDNYNVLINHSNYNPRIIETFTKQKIWNNCDPNDFFKVIKGFFDNPESVWLYSFENSLDKFSQYTLLVLCTLGSPILIKDLELAVESFFLNNPELGIKYDPIKFLKSIKELENTYIRTNLDLNITKEILVDYQNPSVYDFLLNYLNGKERIISYLVNSFIFFGQFYTLFSGQKEDGKIQLSKELIDKLAIRLLEVENNLKHHRVKVTIHEWSYSIEGNKSLYPFLNYLYNHFSEYNNDIERFIYRYFEPELTSEDSLFCSDYINLLESLDLARFDINENKIFASFLNHSYEVSHLDLSLFEKLESIFPNKYNGWINSTHFSDIMVLKAAKVVEFVKTFVSYMSEYKFNLELLIQKYALNLEKYLDELNNISSEYLSCNFDIDYEVDELEIEQENDIAIDKFMEEESIRELFNSLIEN